MVRTLIKNLDVMHIPYCANQCIKAGSKLIEITEDVDNSLKKRLKPRILHRGISL